MELTTIEFKGEDITLSARELHEFLEVKTAYKDWFPRMCEYGFTEGIDFSSILSESTGGRPSVNHQITIDMAKQICMIQRNEKGKMARTYFIELEKKWNTPELIMARALQMAGDTIEEQSQQIKILKTKALFADAVDSSKTSILVNDLAKILKQNGVEIGGQRLFAWLRDNGYLIKREGSDRNSPTQRSMDMGLFEIKETTHADPSGKIHVRITPKVTGKGQVYFVEKFLKKEAIPC